MSFGRVVQVNGLQIGDCISDAKKNLNRLTSELRLIHYFTDEV
jgi:hypothetical protein